MRELSLQSRVFVRPLAVGGVLVRGGSGGGVDRRSSAVGKVTRVWRGHRA
ncbi:MAG: hypothetical protein ABJO05_18565 [Roseibium sp.]